MKQVTGNSPQQTDNKVSIRLAPGGHSFSAEQLPAAAMQADMEVEVVVLTPRTALVPAEVFDAGHANEAARDALGREVLAANGTPLSADECVVWSESSNGIAAVMSANAETVRILREALGGRERFTTPLLHTPQATVPGVWLHTSEGLLYIKVYDGELKFAEVVPAPAEADILYFTELLGREFPLAKYELRIAAEKPKPLRKLIGGRFKRVIQENPI